jgi:hypothetical protein
MLGDIYLLELIDKYYLSGAVAALAREILYWRNVVHSSNDIRCRLMFMSLLHVVMGGALASLVCQEKQFQSIPYALGVGCFWNEFLKLMSGSLLIIRRAQELLESQFILGAVVKSGGDMATSAGYERIAVFAFGVVFVVALLVLAIAFPDPTIFQYTVFRIVLALATSGVAAFVPGFLEVDVGNWVRAGGAIAVFAIIYFFSPAGLVRQATGTPAPTDLFTIHTLESTRQGTQANRFTFP